MSLYRYFTPVLPNPRGLLSEVLPSAASPRLLLPLPTGKYKNGERGESESFEQERIVFVVSSYIRFFVDSTC